MKVKLMILLISLLIVQQDDGQRDFLERGTQAYPTTQAAKKRVLPRNSIFRICSPVFQYIL
jgi:hypothetical protein